MRSVVGDTLALDAYSLRDVAKPKPRPGEVLIRVAACSLGYVDALLAVGGYQVKPPVPYTPGGDLAGTVEAVGEGVDGSFLGARVLAQARAGLSDYVTTSAWSVYRIPENVSFEAAAVFQTNYMTALHGLRDRAQMQRSERLLVFGAAGGVGSATIDVGRLLGAEVIAAGSTEEKRALAAQLGAAHVLDTQPEGWRDRLADTLQGKALDVVFDPVCGPLFEPAFRSLGWRGRHLVVGFVGGPIPALRANLPLMKGAALIGVDIRQFFAFQPQLAAANMGELLTWLGEGRLNPLVGGVFALEDFRAALDHAAGGKGVGKAIVTL